VHPFFFPPTPLRDALAVITGSWEATTCSAPLPARWLAVHPPGAYKLQQCRVRSHPSTETPATWPGYAAQRAPRMQPGTGLCALVPVACQVYLVVERGTRTHPLHAGVHGWSPLF